MTQVGLFTVGRSVGIYKLLLILLILDATIRESGRRIGKYLDIQQIFKVLGDVNRLRIVEALTGECTSVDEIAQKAGISQPLASHHLEALKKAGIAWMESRANFHYY